MADTFNHRVFVYDLVKNTIMLEFPVYYPSSAFWISPEVLLVTAEHTNRIMEYHVDSGKYDYIFGCPHAFVSSTFYTVEVAKAINREKLVAAESTRFPPESLCSENMTGKNTLYSPGSARKYKDTYLISDTDNHRVIVVKDGKAITSVRGFNNPIDAMFIE